MQGKVTIYDAKAKQGHIQANDGNIYSFDALSFTNKNDESLIKEGMSCTFEIIDNKVRNVSFVGGCNGNLQGISRLIDGMDVDEAISRIEGIRCGFKATSCPDQLAQALKAASGK